MIKKSDKSCLTKAEPADVSELMELRARNRELVQTVEQLERSLLEARRLNESLEQRERQSRIILDAVPDLMFRIDGGGRFLHSEGPPEDMVVKSDQVEGGMVGQMLPEPQASTSMSYIRAALESGEMQMLDYSLPTQKGIQQHFEARIAPCGENEVLVIVRNITDRKNAEDELKATLNDKEMLLQEIHHRVKNSLGLISSLLNLQAHSKAAPEIKGILKDSQRRIKAMALVHERLFISENISRIELSQYIRALVNDIRSSFGLISRRVMVDLRLVEKVVSIEIATPLGLIVNELFSNIYKYAFPDSDCTDRRVWVTLDRAAGDESEWYHLGIRDNGVGLPADLDIERAGTLGMQLIRMLTRQLRGTLEVTVKDGTSFDIMFPLGDG